MGPLCLADATELSRLIRTREASPVEVVRSFLDQIDRLNPKVNALCVVNHEQALADAQVAEEAVMNGALLPPLHGVPVVFKDTTDTKDIETTYGSRIFIGNIPEHDAIIVERSRDAGAIILGKSQSPEFAHSGFTRNLVYGGTLNPWDPTRTPGGSSGGAAVAVATAMSPIAEGADGGGSIRIPASCCGVFGLKPHPGRIPCGVMETHFETMLCLGPITWTVRDAALLMSIWSGPDNRDPLSLPATGDDFLGALEKSVAGRRVAYSRDMGLVVVPEVAAVVERALGTLESLGCEVEAVEIGHGQDAVTAFNPLWWGMMAPLFGRYVEEHHHEMTRRVLEQIEFGSRMSATEYQEAQILRSRYYDYLAGILEGFDFLVTPTVSVSPPSVHSFSFGPEEIEGKQVDPQIGWFLTYPFNLTTHPAASVPVGFTEDGLPVGMQVVGRRFGEAEILTLCANLESASPWTGIRPELVTAALTSGVQHHEA